jgi:hypothetical protein
LGRGSHLRSDHEYGIGARPFPLPRRPAGPGRLGDPFGRALRAVALERFAGQVVQVALTVVVLLALPSPVQSSMPLVAIALLGVMFGVGLLA